MTRLLRIDVGGADYRPPSSRKWGRYRRSAVLGLRGSWGDEKNRARFVHREPVPAAGRDDARATRGQVNGAFAGARVDEQVDRAGDHEDELVAGCVPLLIVP